MGISGLLPFLKKSSTASHVREFKGRTVAIDAYCWLHKGAFSCADKLVKGEKTDGYVTYCMKMVNLLISNDIKPILVFDGRHLPSKLVTEIKRRENRERFKIQAREYLRQGNTGKARECFQRCVDVNSAMALQLIKVCRARNIDCIVAPYEADAQLAFLSQQGIADIIITEDSDLLAFGCTRVFFKMDHAGNGVLIERDRLYLSLGGRAEYFNAEKFRRMCILSGCDYLPSLPGIGLGKAFKFFSRTTNADLNSTLCRIPGCLNMPQLEVTTEYREAFLKADQTFLYQLVYDPVNRKVVPLNPYPPELDEQKLPFAGELLDEDISFQLALGNLDVETLEKLDDYNPDTAVLRKQPSVLMKHVSIWSRKFIIKPTQPMTIIESQEIQKPAISRQSCTRVEFSLTKKATPPVQLTDKELTSQYANTESPGSPVLSRKRKRITKENVTHSLTQCSTGFDGHFSESSSYIHLSQDDDSQRSQVTIPAILDPFIDQEMLSPPSKLSLCSGTPRITPLKTTNPFVKLKTPSPAAAAAASNKASPAIVSKFSALKTFSQMRTKNSNGEEVITSTYFRGDKSEADISVVDKLTKTILSTDNHLIPINNTEAAHQPFKPVGIAQIKSSPSIRSFNHPSTKTSPLSSGCRVAGLGRPANKKTPANSKIVANSGLKQLSLRDMFAVKQ